MKKITENLIPKIECDPSPDGTVDKLDEEFIKRQIKEYDYTVKTFIKRLEVARKELDVLEVESDEYKVKEEDIESIQTNLTDCQAQLAYYKATEALLMA